MPTRSGLELCRPQHTKAPPGSPIPDDAFCHETSSFDKDTTVPGDLDGVKAQGQQLTDETLTFALSAPAGVLPGTRTSRATCRTPWGGLDTELISCRAVQRNARDRPDHADGQHRGARPDREPRQPRRRSRVRRSRPAASRT
jgi:hypothetical protein